MKVTDMKKLSLLLFLTTLLSLLCQGENNEKELIEKILKLSPDLGGEIVYFNDFSQSKLLPNLKYSNQFSFDPTGGINGTKAIKCERKSPAQLQDIVVKVPVLQPGKTYVTETVIKADNMKLSGTGIASSSIELFKGKKRVSGGVYSVYRKKDYVPDKWYTLKGKFVISEKGINPRYSIYMMKNTTGRFYIDSLTIKTAGLNSDIVMVKPNNMTLDVNGSIVEYKVTGVPEDALLLLLIINNGKESKYLLKNNQGTYSIVLSNLTLGKVALTVKVANNNGTKLFSQATYNLTVRKFIPPGNSVILDKYQRLNVNGKIFMPIGLYGYKASSNEDLAKISQAGFNCYLDYNTNNWWNKGKNVSGIKEMLDKYSKHNLKCIFNIRWQAPYTGNSISNIPLGKTVDDVTKAIVKNFANHPAVLAWYLSDETTRVNIPQLIHLREVISATDPYHPTLGTSCYPADLASFGNASDIIAVDPYPIGDTASANKKQKQSLKGMLPALNGVNKINKPLWIVPQAFSWGGYRTNDVENFNKWRHPTKEEIKAMPLLAVIYGAKGFIYYTYKPRGYKFSNEYELMRWEALKDSVKELKVLEKYILSSHKIVSLARYPNYECAMLTADDGKRAVVVVGVSEQASGSIKLPDGNWEKVSGTAEVKENKVEFNFPQITSSIFIER